jgi:outer membrane protein OmpA-like peptidoglycan-associated protein
MKLYTRSAVRPLAIALVGVVLGLAASTAGWASSGSTALECVSGKIRYLFAGRYMVEEDAYCFSAHYGTLVAKRCQEAGTGCLVLERLRREALERGRIEIQWSGQGTPGAVLCQQIGGIPQIIEFEAGGQWHALDRCLFPADRSFVDQGSLFATAAELNQASDERALDPIAFDFDKSSIRPDQAARLDILTEWLRLHPERRLLIEGHTDRRATAEYSRQLGERMARAVRDYLVARGVGPERLSVTGIGRDRPVCKGPTELCEARNRRVEFRLLP